jgi:hypothetical protein
MTANQIIIRTINIPLRNVPRNDPKNELKLDNASGLILPVITEPETSKEKFMGGFFKK